MRRLSVFLNSLTINFDLVKLVALVHPKRLSNTIRKGLFFLFTRFKTSSHTTLLGLLFSVMIIAFIYGKLSTASELNTITCPDRYAYEDTPGVFIPCTDWDEFVKLYESKKSYRHLTLKRSY